MVSKRTRLISGLVAILMLVSMFTAFSVPVIADTGVSIGSSNETGLADVSALTDIKDYNSSITEYKVTDYEGMRKLADLVYGGNTLDNVTIYQANDIDMGGMPFAGIGRNGKPFSGTFDGNGFTIDNLYVLRNDSDATGVGLIGSLSNGEVRNVGISGGLIVGRNATGAIVGITTADTNNAIINCWNAATVVGALDKGTAGILGLARVGSNTVENCYNLGMIVNTAKTAAGIVGMAEGGTTAIKNCYNAGELVTGFSGLNAYTSYSAIFAVDLSQTYLAGAGNYYIKNRGIRASIDEYRAATGNEDIKAIDGATGLEESALTDGTLSAKLSGIESDVTGWELSFTDVGAGYPVITYTKKAAVEGEEDVVIARAAKSDINVNGDQSWVEDSELFANVYAGRNKALGGSTLSNLYIKSANDLFVLGMITLAAHYKSALGVSNNGYVYLANDVDMNDQTLFPGIKYYLPISSGGYVFNGTFDGQKNVIYNWNVYAYFTSGYGQGGLFTQANGTIKNLGVANASTIYERMPTENAGYLYPALIVERKARDTAVLTMDNCFATGTMTMVNVTNHNNNGGVFSTAWADTNYPTITNCWSDVDVIDEKTGAHTKARTVGKVADGFKSTISNCYYVSDVEPFLGKKVSYGATDNGAWYHLRNGRLPESHYSSKDGSLAAYFNGIGFGSWTVKNGTTVFKKDTDSMYKVTLKKMVDDETGYVVSETYYAPGETVTIPGEIDGYTRRLGGATIQMPENDLTIEYTKEGFDRSLAEQLVAKYGNGNYDAELFENGSSVVQAYENASAALAADDDATAIEKLAIAVAHANKAGEPVLKMEVGAYPYYSKRDVYAPLMPSQDWGISSRADWEQVILDSPSNSFSDYVFHFNNDVDFGETPIAPVNAANKKAFGGTVNGHGFKILNLNINWDVADGRWVGLIGYASNAVVRDLTIENGSIRAFGTNKDEHMVGSFIGEGYQSLAINCRNNADIDATATAVPSGGQSISGIGRFTGSSVIDGCINTGDVSGHGFVYGISGYSQGATYVVNCYTTGALYSTRKCKDKGIGLARFNGADKDAYMKNSYIVGYDYCEVQNHKTEAQWRLEEEDLASGALAGMLNANHYNDSTVSVWRQNPLCSDNSRPYFKLDENGDTVWCTSAEQTRTLTMNCEGHETKYLYGENGDTVTLNYADNVTYEMDSGSGTLDAEAGTFTFAGSNAVIYITNHGKLYDVMDPLLGSFEGANPAFFGAEGVEDFGAFLAAVREKRANDSYADQAEIDADVSILQSAKWTAAYPNLPSVTEVTKYPAAAGYLIKTADDLRYVAANASKFTTAHTLYLANDLDMTGETFTGIENLYASFDGKHHTISNWTWDNMLNLDKADASKDTGFFKKYRGASIKDLTMKSVKVSTDNRDIAILISKNYSAKLTIENVHLIDCVVTMKNTKFEANSIGAFMGVSDASNAVINFKDCSARDSVIQSSEGAMASGNLGFIVGVARSGGTFNLTNVLIEGCTLGVHGAGAAGFAVGMVENAKGHVVMDHVAILNNRRINSDVGWNNRGLAIGLIQKEGSIDLDHVVVLNNDQSFALQKKGSTSVAESWNITFNLHPTATVANSSYHNVYTDETVVSSDLNKGTHGNLNYSVKEDQYGEIAYTLNNAGGHWTVDDNVVILTSGVEGAADTVAVTLKASDVLYDIMEESKATATLYTDANGKLLGLDAIKGELNKWAVWDFEAIEAATYDADNNVAYGTPILAHEHVWSYTAGDGTHDAECIWESNGQECPWYVEDVACTYTEGAACVDPNAAPADAKHAGSCVCGNVSEGVLCSSDAENWIVTVTKKATCFEAGNTNYVCLTCGYVANEPIAQREHSLGAWVADKNEDDTFKFTHTAACTHTDPACDYSETKACTFEDNWAQTKAPSVTEEGEEIRYCVDGCGSYETRAIAALTGFVVESELGLRGDTMDVYIDIKNNPGISGAVIDITYDSANIELDQAALVIDQKDQQIPAPGLTEGEGTMVTSTVSFAFYGNYTGEDLLKLTFNVKEGATVGKHSFTVTTEDHAVANYDLEWIEVKDWTGEIEIADFIRGDVDRDRVVTIADAVLLLRYCNADDEGKTALVETYDFDARAADIDGNEGVAVADVIKILQYLNHMIDVI